MQYYKYKDIIEVYRKRFFSNNINKKRFHKIAKKEKNNVIVLENQYI